MEQQCLRKQAADLFEDCRGSICTSTNSSNNPEDDDWCIRPRLGGHNASLLPGAPIFRTAIQADPTMFRAQHPDLSSGPALTFDTGAQRAHSLCGHSSLWATLLLPPRHRASLTTHLNLHPWSPARGTSNHHIQIGHSIHLCRRLNGQTVRLMSIFTTDLASSPSF